MQIHYLLVVRSCKHKEIFNYYWYDKLKSDEVWCGFFSGFYHNPVGFLGIYHVWTLGKVDQISKKVLSALPTETGPARYYKSHET